MGLATRFRHSGLLVSVFLLPSRAVGCQRRRTVRSRICNPRNLPVSPPWTPLTEPHEDNADESTQGDVDSVMGAVFLLSPEGLRARHEVSTCVRGRGTMIQGREQERCLSLCIKS